MMRKILICLSSWLFAVSPVGACSSFLIPSSREKIMAKNYDWTHNDGMLVVNKRNLAKTAFGGMAKPARWISRFGSVTFNQHGRELPLGGLNEAGLAVEVMWLDASVYAPSGSVPAVNELQWIQYQLDNYSSVAELAANVDKIAVHKVSASVHYLACDRSEECAVVEFLKGKLELRSGKDLFVNTLTNDPYDAAVAFAKTFKGFGGDRHIPADSSSLSRFVRASYLAANPPVDGIAEEAYAFQILESVHQAGSSQNPTQWNIAYSLAASRIAFRSQGDAELQTVAAGTFDYSCSQPTQVLEMNQGLSGDVAGHFVSYTRALNKKIVERGLGAMMPPQVIDAVVAYPESTVCLEQPASKAHVSVANHDAGIDYFK